MVIILDFETTGLSPNPGARPIEAAAVGVEPGQIADRLQSLMYSGVFVPAFVTVLTGVTRARVRAAPGVDRVMRELYAFIDGQPIVAHDTRIDRQFLEAEWRRPR